MDLRQIQYFIALFEDGSVTRAARRLNIVQPALSMQIGRLEEELGQRLFERGPHGMSPTAAGRRMYRLYLPIMRDIAVARQQMVQQDEMVAGHVSIGVIASITESVMADALLTFHRRYPNVEVSVSDGYSATLIDWVTGGQLDTALVNKPRAPMSLTSQSLLDEELVLVTGVQHGPKLPATVELGKLQNLELVLTTKRHGLRGVIEAAAQAEGVYLAPRFEIDVLSAIVKLVETTQFATILPRIAVQRAVQQRTLRMHAIIAPRILRHVVRVTHPRRPLSAAADALTGIIVEHIRAISDADVLEPPMTSSMPASLPLPGSLVIRPTLATQ